MGKNAKSGLLSNFVIVVFSIIGALVVGGVFYVALQNNGDAAKVRDGVDRAIYEISKPQVEIDTTVSVPASKFYHHKIVLERGGEIKIDVQGVRDTAKGFSVYVVDEPNLQKMIAREQFQYIAPLAATHTSAATIKGWLKAGTYRVTVYNDENVLNSMEVAIKVHVD